MFKGIILAATVLISVIPIAIIYVIVALAVVLPALAAIAEIAFFAECVICKPLCRCKKYAPKSAISLKAQHI